MCQVTRTRHLRGFGDSNKMPGIDMVHSHYTFEETGDLCFVTDIADNDPFIRLYTALLLYRRAELTWLKQLRPVRSRVLAKVQ